MWCTGLLIAAVFFPLFILLAFSPPFLLKLQLSRHEGPCGPDQMFQAPHFPTLCLMEYSWATRHRSKAQQHTAPTTDHLFIYFITLLPDCLMHNNNSTFNKSIFSPSCFPNSHSHHILFPAYFFCGAYLSSFGILMGLSLSLSLSSCPLSFIRQMGVEWMECWITDVCLWGLMVVLKYKTIIYNPA